MAYFLLLNSLIVLGIVLIAVAIRSNSFKTAPFKGKVFAVLFMTIFGGLCFYGLGNSIYLSLTEEYSFSISEYSDRLISKYDKALQDGKIDLRRRGIQKKVTEGDFVDSAERVRYERIDLFEKSDVNKDSLVTQIELNNLLKNFDKDDNGLLTSDPSLLRKWKGTTWTDELTPIAKEYPEYIKAQAP